MIRELRFQNFKSLRDVRVGLERFTVVVGPNASGKSSLLQGLELLCRSGETQAGFDGNVLPAWASHGSNDEVVLSAKSDSQRYRFFHPSRPAEQSPAGLIAPYQQQTHRQIVNDPESEDWRAWRTQGDIKNSTPRAVLLRLEASKLISAHVQFDPQAGMQADGTGIHAHLMNMALNDPDSWQNLQADLRGIIPTIRRLRHTKSGQNQPASLLFDVTGATSLSAIQVSEGTLLVLGLLGALYAPARPDLVLLDDLDRGLHPKAQRDLIALLRRLLDTNADLQIVASTHSPYLLDCMEPDEVRMTCLRDDGSTVCAPLAKHPKFEKWKDEMYPGEMWSLFGEKWLVEEGARA